MLPKKEDISWTVIMSVFVSNGEHEEALRFFNKMDALGNKVSSEALRF